MGCTDVEDALKYIFFFSKLVSRLLGASKLSMKQQIFNKMPKISPLVAN